MLSEMPFWALRNVCSADTGETYMESYMLTNNESTNLLSLWSAGRVSPSLHPPTKRFKANKQNMPQYFIKDFIAIKITMYKFVTLISH